MKKMLPNCSQLLFEMLSDDCHLILNEIYHNFLNVKDTYIEVNTEKIAQIKLKEVKLIEFYLKKLGFICNCYINKNENYEDSYVICVEIK